MGLRMYINEHTCLGKCFGYGGFNTSLYSLDYLCSIDAFKDWGINKEIWDRTLVGDMADYFVCSQCTEDIFLTPEQFMRFVYLYISDGLAIWGPEHWSVEGCVDTLRQVMNDIECEPDKKISIHWG